MVLQVLSHVLMGFCKIGQGLLLLPFCRGLNQGPEELKIYSQSRNWRATEASWSPGSCSLKCQEERLLIPVAWPLPPPGPVPSTPDEPAVLRNWNGSRPVGAGEMAGPSLSHTPSLSNQGPSCGQFSPSIHALGTLMEILFLPNGLGSPLFLRPFHILLFYQNVSA